MQRACTVSYCVGLYCNVHSLTNLCVSVSAGETFFLSVFLCVCVLHWLCARPSVCVCVCVCVREWFSCVLRIPYLMFMCVCVCVCVCVCNVPARRTSLFRALVAVWFTFIFWPKLLRGNKITLWYQS